MRPAALRAVSRGSALPPLPLGPESAGRLSAVQAGAKLPTWPLAPVLQLPADQRLLGVLPRAVASRCTRSSTGLITAASRQTSKAALRAAGVSAAASAALGLLANPVNRQVGSGRRAAELVFGEPPGIASAAPESQLVQRLAHSPARRLRPSSCSSPGSDGLQPRAGPWQHPAGAGQGL